MCALGGALQASDAPPATAPHDTVKETAAETASERPGDRIGRYKLLQKLGEGGMGAVWMAEQEEPVRRKVALKVIKLGMDTKAVIARFEAERQALALMDHPNIAKIYDAGVTGELVAGSAGFQPALEFGSVGGVEGGAGQMGREFFGLQVRGAPRREAS